MIADIQFDIQIEERDAIVTGNYFYLKPTRENPCERWFAVTDAHYADPPYETVSADDLLSEERLIEFAERELRWSR